MSFYSRHRFTVLLAALLLLMGSRLVISGSRIGELILNLCGLFLLVAAILTLCADRRLRGAALLAGIPPVIIVGFSGLLPQAVAESTRLVGRGWAAAFLAFTVIMIVRAVITARNVTWDTIVGALTGYVLMGIVWTEMYSALELGAPQSFASIHFALNMRDDPVNTHAVLEYFSFATLSTVGYGDVAPVSRAARALATLEAICGQFYLAVLVAGLVGIRGSRSTAQTPDTSSSDAPQAK